MTQKIKNVLRLTPTVVLALALAAGAIMKIAAASPVKEVFKETGLLAFMFWIGIAELIYILLFVYKQTTQLGLLLLTAHLGGAIAIELVQGGPVFVPALFLVIVWIAAGLRHPGLFRVSKINSIADLRTN
jgi:hypothetical protein